mmetsp:Transcript_9427/g.27702  ORF Transcript_9427/g.27702 Transcript_9427/m.27702 type:complete len:219 (+) Transcript_9427:236-892(+)
MERRGPLRAALDHARPVPAPLGQRRLEEAAHHGGAVGGAEGHEGQRRAAAQAHFVPAELGVLRLCALREVGAGEEGDSVDRELLLQAGEGLEEPHVRVEGDAAVVAQDEETEVVGDDGRRHARVLPVELERDLVGVLVPELVSPEHVGPALGLVLQLYLVHERHHHGLHLLALRAGDPDLVDDLGDLPGPGFVAAAAAGRCQALGDGVVLVVLAPRER